MSTAISDQQSFDSKPRKSQHLCNEGCQTMVFKAAFEHFSDLPDVAVLLVTSNSFQNSSFGANFLVNFKVDKNSIRLFSNVLSPSSCLSLQLVPSLYIESSSDHLTYFATQSPDYNEPIKNFIGEFVETKYLHLQLRSLTLRSDSYLILPAAFGTSIAWTQLRCLDLQRSSVDEEVMEIIVKSAVHLTKLILALSDGCSDDCLLHVSSLANLEFLNLERCNQITDVGLEHLSKLSNVTCLDLAHCNKITDAGLHHIADLPSLTFLDLSLVTAMTDAGLECIARLPAITRIKLNCCKSITDMGLHHLATVSGITSLDLTSCSAITDAGLQHISRLSGLTELDLWNCPAITDTGLEHLSTLPRLVELNLRYLNKITDGGLRLISRLSTLTYLDVSNCSLITDAGFEQLSALSNLNILESVGTKVSADAKTKLKEKLTNCQVI